jgi:hypothetical protein
LKPPQDEALIRGFLNLIADFFDIVARPFDRAFTGRQAGAEDDDGGEDKDPAANYRNLGEKLAFGHTVTSSSR